MSPPDDRPAGRGVFGFLSSTVWVVGLIVIAVIVALVLLLGGC
jgi:hypothetical protein